MVESTLDAQIAQFRVSLDRLLKEMGDLAESDLPLEKAFDEILMRLEGATGATGSAVWLKSSNPSVEDDSAFDIAFDRAVRSARPADALHRRMHQRRLRKIVASRESAVLHDDGVQLLAPIAIGEQMIGVLEVDVDPAKGRQGATGRLQFVEKTASIVGRSIRNRRFAELDRRARLWDGLESFLAVVSKGRNVTETAYLIANEGRRFLQCDRLTVLRRRGMKAKVVAISGQETVSRRANGVRLLSRLVTQALKHNERYVFDGHHPNDWPQSVADALEAYLKENHSRLLILQPLFDPERSQKHPNRPAEAALVAEIMQGDPPDDAFPLRLDSVARHGGRALFRSIDESRVPLRPILHPVGRLMAGAVTTRTKRILLWTTLALITTSALMFISVPFRVEGKGRLYPRDRQKIFAPLAGTVAQVHVKHGSSVTPNSDLLTLENPTLIQELTRAQAELKNKAATLRSMELVQDRAIAKPNAADDGQLVARRIELEVEVERLKRGVELLDRQIAQLQLRSPRSGAVLDWNPDDLLRKHCQPGEELLEVGDVNGDWIVEVDFPEKNATAIGRSAEGSVGRDAWFILSSSPDASYRARLDSLGASVRVIERENVLRGRCTILEAPRSSLLRSGIEVRVRVDCGERALGYVLFRDVVDFVRGVFFY